MNQFLDVEPQIMLPRRSHQDILMQKLRKRVIPIFKRLNKQSKNISHHASLDPYKKSSTNRFKTCAIDEQNQFFTSSQSNDRPLNASMVSSKRAALIDSCHSLKQQQKINESSVKRRKILLPKLINRKLNFVNMMSPEYKDEIQVRIKKTTKTEVQQQLVTFYPFKHKKTLSCIQS